MLKNQKEKTVIVKDLGLRDSTWIRPDTGKPKRKRYYIIECPICSNHVEVMAHSYKRNPYMNCISCNTKNQFTKHGHTIGRKKSNLWQCWSDMKSRCLNKSHKSYRYYGARGVTVSKEWIDDFKAFEKWSMENGYKEGLELDKDKICFEQNIHPKIYSSDTCIWMSGEENRRKAWIEKN